MSNETESTRQQKVARQIQRDIGDIFSKEAASLLCGAMVSVTLVRMSPDLELAKVYLSVFPFEKHAAVMESLEKNNWLVRKALPKSFWWPVIFSAGVFGSGHQAGPAYLACMLVTGLIWAFAYLSRFERRGFAQAFWLVFLIHASNNAIAFII